MFKKVDNVKAALFTSCILFCFGFLNVASAQSIYLEWVDNPLETMVVNWIDDPGGNTTVEYRPEGSGNWSSSGGSTRNIPGTSQELYTVKLSGLSAGQGYEFRVGGNNQIHKFRTAPDNLAEPLRFIVAGDILDDPVYYDQAKENFVEVSEHAAAADPHFAVFGGDLAHAEGGEARVSHWLEMFELWHENMVTDGGYQVPILAAPGNNEVPNNFGDDPEDAVYYYTFFRYPQDQWGPKISYGRLDFENYLSIVTLDSDHTHRIPGTQTSWLNNTLNNRKNFRHVIPVYHVAGWPVHRTLRGTQEDLVRHNWHPVFRNNGIRLVFEHHDHIYKRTEPIGDCVAIINNPNDCNYGNNAKNGVIYMGGGSWGSDNNREGEARWYIDEMTRLIHNFVVVEITNNYRKATAVGENGQILDEFTDYVFLDSPVTLAPGEITEKSFVARWEEVEGAANYRLDVSTNNNFSSYLNGFQNRNVGDNTSWVIDGLDPAEIYYYRVRAQNILTTSKNSDAVTVQLVKVDPDLSSMIVSKDTAVADDQDNSTVTVTVIDEDGELIPNLSVEIFAVEGNLEVVDKIVDTNEEGQAEFTVFNDRPEEVTYGAIAGNEEITQKVQVTFIPRPPVALAATDVETREFTANWEVVDETDYYLLDVATDSSFSNMVPSYQGLDVGNVTSHTVEGLNPGVTYHYRVRAVVDDLIGVNSQTITTTTFPETPVAEEPDNISVISFRANWDAAEGARNYRLDVAEDQSFDNFVEGFENRDVENVQAFEVDGLLPGRDYYYRVRAEAGPRLSGYSNIVGGSTFRIDTDASEITSAQLRVLANGDQANEIYVLIRSENGDIQEGVDVQLIAENGNSQIEEIESVTDEEGVATFGVTNTTPETVTYSVVAATVDVGEISVEFLEDEGVLQLGNNFPNPFRIESFIPLSIPRSMHVELKVYNSLGSPVRTLKDEEMNVGYFEIPFNGADLAAGVYFYRLITEEGAKTRKMVLVK